MAEQSVGAVIPAAGQSRRMGGVDKLWAFLGDRTVLEWVLDTFEECTSIAQIVVAVSGASLVRVQQLAEAKGYKKIEVCPGGRRRQDSVAAGLSCLRGCDWVVIHDGARPFVTADLIERGLAAARETGAAVAAVPVTDTIKVAGRNLIVKETPARQSLWAAQTPQVFRFDIIAAAYRQARGEVTDDASLVERLGHRVKLYMGTNDNMKITTFDDLVLAEALWRKRQG